MRTYFVDGKAYYERIIDQSNIKNGIIALKRLPTETMDYIYNVKTGKITYFFQYLNINNFKRPVSFEDAQNRKDLIVFEPGQIGYIDYGLYGMNKTEVFGYLENAKVPYNQLKLLETSVIIYRIVRAPERFVFKIDVGNMPRDKATEFVEKVKMSMMKKQAYDPQSGKLTNQPDVLSTLDNFFIPTSGEGRGSDISTVGGGQHQGFTELSDLYYFSRKLYRSLKYPMSRVSATEEKKESSITFSNSPLGEIARDEIKWAIFLERQQEKLCNELTDLFLLHLDFKGLKKQYNLDKSRIDLTMNPPSYYKDKQKQMVQEVKFSNYLQLAHQEEFAKVYLMRKYLEMTEEEIKENSEGLKEDLELGFKQQLPQMQGGDMEAPEGEQTVPMNGDTKKDIEEPPKEQPQKENFSKKETLFS
jgi:hypothetical protein